MGPAIWGGPWGQLVSRIFLSHASADNRAAIALKRWLTEQRPQLASEIFLDIDSNSGLRPGGRWKSQLFKENARCELVICLLSKNWEASHECKVEYRTAEGLGKQILCARLEDLGETDITSEWQRCDLFAEGSKTQIDVLGGPPVAFNAVALDQLRKAIEGTGVGPENFVWPPAEDPRRPPYRGWEPFEPIDAGVFFGRDAAVLRGLDELRTMRLSGVKSMFVVLGPSGSGKSSFLRAGLIPRLQREDRRFRVLGIVRPDREPLTGSQGLAAAIHHSWRDLGLRGVRLGDVKKACQDDPRRILDLFVQLRDAAAARVHDSGQETAPTLVLPLDQAEELFSTDAGVEAGDFLQLIAQLVGAMNAVDVGLIVAATIRTDRYEAMQDHPSLNAVSAVLFNELRPMPSHQFREVINGPAARTGDSDQRVNFAPELVDRLLADATSDTTVGGDTLPLLSLVLARLYSDWIDGGADQLTVDDYEVMGGMRDIVNDEIERVLTSHPGHREDNLELLRSAFIPWLASINPDNDQPMRRVARWVDVPNSSRSLIDALVAKRLMVKDIRDGEVVVEVALESLLRQWDELASWLREERQNLLTADDLESNASAWVTHGNDPAWLLSGTRLSDAENLARSAHFADRLRGSAEYLSTSRKAEDRRLKAIAVEQRRRRTRVLRVALSVTAVIALVAGLTGWQLYESFRHATGLRLASEAEQMLNGSRWGGDVLALQQLLAAQHLGVINAAGIANKRTNVVRIIENPQPKGGEVSVTSVRQLAVDGHSDRIATANDDGTVRVWEPATGALVLTIDLGDDRPSSVAMSTDGNLLATGSDDGFVQIWNARSGKEFRSPLTGSDPDPTVPWTISSVDSVAFSPDGSAVAAGSSDGLVRVWDLHRGKMIAAARASESGAVYSVAFSPSGDRLVTIGRDAVRLWEPRTGKQIAEINSQNAPATSVAFSPPIVSTNPGDPEDRLVVGFSDGTIEVVDGRTLLPIQTFRAHAGTVTSVAFSPDGTRILSGSSDNTVRVWDSITGEPIGSALVGHHGLVTSVAFDATATRIISGGTDGSVRVWDTRTALPIPAQQGTEVRAVAFSADGRAIASGGADGTVKLWSESTAAQEGVLGEAARDYERAINGLAYSPDGDRIVTGASDGALQLWNLGSLENPIVITRRDTTGSTRKRISNVAFSPDGSRIATGDSEGALRLWDGHTLEPIGEVHTDGNPVWSIAFSPDGRQIVSGSGSGNLFGARERPVIQFWDVDPLEKAGDPIEYKTDGLIRVVGFSSDGKAIASGTSDGVIRLLDSNSHRQTGTAMQADQNAVITLAFAHHHPWIVSGSADGKVRLWDSETHQPIGIAIDGHTNYVTSVAFSPDDKWILSGGADGNLRLWPTSQDLKNFVCDRVNMSMSREQWDQSVSRWIPYEALCPGSP